MISAGWAPPTIPHEHPSDVPQPSGARAPLLPRQAPATRAAIESPPLRHPGRTRPLHSRLTTAFRLLPFLAVLAGAAGCGYMVGAPIAPDIRTIAVPIATTDSFRRGIEFQLTEAVHKQIQTTTPLRLVNEPFADARLTLHIVDVRKDVLGETAFDDPRELQVTYAVLATLVDLRTGSICQEQIPIPPEALPLVARAEFAPEVGHSLATAQHRALEDLARQIVEKLEAPW